MSKVITYDDIITKVVTYISNICDNVDKDPDSKIQQFNSSNMQLLSFVYTRTLVLRFKQNIGVGTYSQKQFTEPIPRIESSDIRATLNQFLIDHSLKSQLEISATDFVYFLSLIQYFLQTHICCYARIKDNFKLTIYDSNGNQSSINEPQRYDVTTDEVLEIFDQFFNLSKETNFIETCGISAYFTHY